MSEHAHGVSPNGHTHEKTDAQTRPIFRFVAGMAVGVAAAMVLMAMLYSYFSEREAALDATVSPLAAESPLPAPEPALEPRPSDNLRQLLRDEQTRISSYGWVDEPEGLVRIPIERAIDLMAERGFPARPQSGNAPQSESAPRSDSAPRADNASRPDHAANATTQ